MMTSPKACPFAGRIIAIALLCGTLPAQDQCSTEAKLLLSPDETRAVVTALGAAAETNGQVYLFDTDKLELLSQGVILRLRQGTSYDLMVKLRPQGAREILNPAEKGGKYKCEVDVAGGDAQLSYSITSTYTGKQVPITGTALFDLLTPAQKKLVESSRVSINWSRVHRMADIQSTEWQIVDLGGFHKLALALWKWPSGQVLELSTKPRTQGGPEAYRELRQLATGKGLVLSDRQKLKTTIVLESVTLK